MKQVTKVLVVVSVAILAGCAGGSAGVRTMFSQATLPEAVKVPMGHSVVMETVGIGSINYECRAKKDTAGQFEWAFVGPSATLADRSGKTIGRYYGPPASWEANDGSKVTGTQLAVAPGGDGNIPLQLVKANPAVGMGAMQDVSFIQRVATRGGVAPAMACATGNTGQKQTVQYQADYIFWRAV